MIKHIAHVARDQNPMETLCGEPWQWWQEPDRGAMDEEMREMVGERELLRIKAEERTEREKMVGQRVRQCQACFKAMTKAWQ